MNRSTRLLWAPLLATAALFLPPLEARADSPRFEFTPFVGGRIGGGFDVVAADDTSSSVDLDAGISYGLDLGLYGDSHGFYELLYSTQTTSLDSADPLLDGVDLRIDYLQFGGTALFPQEGDFFVPYLSLTIGATLMEPDASGYDSETKFSGSIGGGVRIPFNDNVALNLGVRGYLTFIDSDTDLFCVSNAQQAGCLVRSSGSTFFQAEGQVGLSVRF
ncbi:MAG: outer membrane beta-barrel protein [Steroidobacteraceae bacterium]